MSWAVLAVAGSQAPQHLARTLGLPLIDDPSGASRVVHVGDDASLAALADRVGPDLPILHQPSVSSDLARMFGSTAAADRLTHGREYPTDLIEVRSEAGRHVAVGHAVASVTGGLPGALAGSKSLVLDRDGRIDRVRGAAVVIANCQHVGGFTMAPRAAVMDGRADLQVIGGGRLDRMRLRPSMRRGLHLPSRAIQRRSVRSVAFELPARWNMRCDGRPVDGVRWELAVVPAAATLWV